jgi:hypothetical protein
MSENKEMSESQEMSEKKERGVDYRFLLGKAFRLQDQVYIASAVSSSGDVDIVRASTRVRGEDVMRTFPAHIVVDHLVCDEEIELAEVGLSNWV